jgi:2-oxoglutarate/2-oxoacid ferredoxin oxidoreductase subunit alpha
MATQSNLGIAAIQSVNDFVVKFANVNGSGSASANGLFARSILRMGIPASSRNIFPSNIQGLPTWYEVRISESSHLGRRGGVDLMVAMNPETWDEDVAEIEPGGYLFYDSTKPLPPSKFRDDVNVIGAPLTAICNREYEDARQRQLFKNIIYLGALSALLDIDVAAIEKLIGEQFRGKDALIKPNLHALHLGRDWALSTLDCPIGLHLRRADAVGERIFVTGNDAAALGCVYGGATVAAWYPITPSSSLAEAFSGHCHRLRRDPETKKKRFAIIQAEDELAAIGVVIGAAWNGARAFTATAGPGISLMQEFIGLAYFAEIPAVIFDIQRGSPSTGMPTRTQQADILSCAYASHGDTKHVLLFPQDPRESFSFAADALDLADRLQTPIFVMMDLDIGMNEWLVEPLAWDEGRRYDRGKVMTAEMLEAGVEFGRYLDVDGDGIPYRTYPGTHPTRGSFFTRGTSKDRYARYSEEGPDYVDNMQRLLHKFETVKRLVPRPVKRAAREPTRFGALYFGSTAAAMSEALEALEERGIHLDMMRVRAFPFHDDILDFIAGHDRVFVIEQNRDAQLRTLLISEGEIDPARLVPILHYDGTPITARFIVKAIADMLAVVTLAPLKKALPRSSTSYAPSPSIPRVRQDGGG